jgi:putative GTP pyrophosphokinase
LTNSQVNRLGDRLRKGQSLADDPEALDAYRESFIEAYQLVIRTLRDLSFEPSGRIKTAMSIVEKLKRESIRLSKLQDIAGCRVVVANIKEQDRVVDRISRAFPGAKIMDRRKQPSHGYRAVHIVVAVVEKLVEIQVRTELQQLWAAWSEALGGALDQSIKYGGGPAQIRRILYLESEIIAALESAKRTLDRLVLSAMWSEVAGKSLGPNFIAASRWAGTLKDLSRREQAVKDRLEREILELDFKKS